MEAGNLRGTSEQRTWMLLLALFTATEQHTLWERSFLPNQVAVDRWMDGSDRHITQRDMEILLRPIPQGLEILATSMKVQFPQFVAHFVRGMNLIPIRTSRETSALPRLT